MQNKFFISDQYGLDYKHQKPQHKQRTMNMLCSGNFIKCREQTKISFIKSRKDDHENRNEQNTNVFI